MNFHPSIDMAGKSCRDRNPYFQKVPLLGQFQTESELKMLVYIHTYTHTCTHTHTHIETYTSTYRYNNSKWCHPEDSTRRFRRTLHRLTP